MLQIAGNRALRQKNRIKENKRTRYLARFNTTNHLNLIKSKTGIKFIKPGFSNHLARMEISIPGKWLNHTRLFQHISGRVIQPDIHLDRNWRG